MSTASSVSIRSFIKAADRGDVDLVRAMLIEQPDLGRKSTIVGTALMCAAEHGHRDCVELLLPHSDAKATDATGCSALILAARKGQRDCIQLLLPESDVKALDKEGMSALIWAAICDHATCVELRLPESQINARDAEGCSALMWAAVQGNPECLRLLLPHSDAKLVNKQGWSALMRAADEGSDQCLALLLAHSDTKAEDPQGRSAFDLAVVMAIRINTQERWACVDLLSSTVSLERLRLFVESPEFEACPPPPELPRGRATLEREALIEGLVHSRLDHSGERADLKGGARPRLRI